MAILGGPAGRAGSGSGAMTSAAQPRPHPVTLGPAELLRALAAMDDPHVWDSFEVGLLRDWIFAVCGAGTCMLGDHRSGDRVLADLPEEPCGQTRAPICATR